MNIFLSQLSVQLIQRLTRLKSIATGARSAASADNLTSKMVQNLHQELVTWNEFYNSVTGTGVATAFQDYIRTQTTPPDPSIEVTTQVVDINNYVNSVGAWLSNSANLDKNAGGFVPGFTISGTSLTYRVFTSAETTDLQGILTNLISAINTTNSWTGV